MDAVEERLAALAHELRTGRLVVVGPDGVERIVAEVVHGTAELTVGLGDARPQRTGVVLFASRPTPLTAAGTGLQAWTEGDQRIELAAWSDGDDWRAGWFPDRAPPRWGPSRTSDPRGEGPGSATDQSVDS
ncbi:MAG: hypothetical protein ACYCU7_05195 [Acidimicrobiales bacterium]